MYSCLWLHTLERWPTGWLPGIYRVLKETSLTDKSLHEICNSAFWKYFEKLMFYNKGKYKMMENVLLIVIIDCYLLNSSQLNWLHHTLGHGWFRYFPCLPGWIHQLHRVYHSIINNLSGKFRWKTGMWVLFYLMCVTWLKLHMQKNCSD